MNRCRIDLMPYSRLPGLRVEASIAGVWPLKDGRLRMIGEAAEVLDAYRGELAGTVPAAGGQG